MKQIVRKLAMLSITDPVRAAYLADCLEETEEMGEQIALLSRLKEQATGEDQELIKSIIADMLEINKENWRLINEAG